MGPGAWQGGRSACWDGWRMQLRQVMPACGARGVHEAAVTARTLCHVPPNASSACAWHAVELSGRASQRAQHPQQVTALAAHALPPAPLLLFLQSRGAGRVQLWAAALSVRLTQLPSPAAGPAARQHSQVRAGWECNAQTPPAAPCALPAQPWASRQQAYAFWRVVCVH